MTYEPHVPWCYTEEGQHILPKNSQCRVRRTRCAMLPCEPCIVRLSNTGHPSLQLPRRVCESALCAYGPVRATAGAERGQHVATFLGDYSKFSVMRLLTRKADVSAMVKRVLTMMETQCGHRCSVVMTENL